MTNFAKKNVFFKKNCFFFFLFFVDEELTIEDLISIKKASAPAVPRPATATSIPQLLQTLQVYKTKQKIVKFDHFFVGFFRFFSCVLLCDVFSERMGRHNVRNVSIEKAFRHRA